MAYDKDAASELKRQIEECFNPGWDDFKTQREREHNVIQRKAKVKVDSNLAAWEDGIDPQSSMLLFDRSQHMQILTMDASKVDVIALESSEDAKKTAEKKRMYLAAKLGQMNENGRIDGPWSQGISDNGLIVFRYLFKMPPEMDEKERDTRVGKMRAEDEDDDTYEAKKSERELKARDEYFKDYQEDCFWVQALGSLSAQVGAGEGRPGQGQVFDA
jgi:hypothetical protein